MVRSDEYRKYWAHKGAEKFYRLARGWNWWSNEQPSTETKQTVERRLRDLGNQIDVVLSHTCPLKYEPIEVFISGIAQSTVDKTTEKWLDDIEERVTYRKWYCGHYHTSKKIAKLEFLFEDF
jgi:3-oxoacid CoA-transferase subunit A